MVVVVDSVVCCAVSMMCISPPHPHPNSAHAYLFTTALVCTNVPAGAEPSQPLPADVHPQRVVRRDIDIHSQVKLAPVDQEGSANVSTVGAGGEIERR